MMTVHEVSRLTGVSIRTLQYYDKIGLLKPSAYTESGYRLYDDTALHRLQQILLLRELGFPLKDIPAILDAPGDVRRQALDRQIRQLEAKRQRLQDRISMAAIMKVTEVNNMDFEQFDANKMDDRPTPSGARPMPTGNTRLSPKAAARKPTRCWGMT